MIETKPQPVGCFVKCEHSEDNPPSPETLKMMGQITECWKEAVQELKGSGGAMPGEFPEWDTAAWARLEAKVGHCRCEEADLPEDYECPLDGWMLMDHLSETLAEFKKRNVGPRCETVHTRA